MRFRFLVVLAIFTCTSATSAGVRDTVYLQALGDLTLYEDSLGGLANGAGQHMFVGRPDTTSVGARRRALIRFDIAGSIPSGAFISEATLTLNMSQTSSDSQLIELHSLTSMWTEGPSDPPGNEGAGSPSQSGDATWIHCSFNTNFWDSSGGDFDHFVADTTWVAGPGQYTWNSMYVAAAVKQWLDTPATNFGWILVGNEDTTKTTKRFDTREHPVDSLRPELMVVYLIPSWIPLPVRYDNVLYESATGDVSNGQGQYLWAGRTDAPSESIRRSYITANFASAIPSGSLILYARLTLQHDSAAGGPATYDLHRLLRPPGEGASNAAGNEAEGATVTAFDGTWLHYQYPDSLWTLPGGDFDPVPSSSTLIETLPGAAMFWDSSLTRDVQLFVDSGYSNAGWLVKTDESTGNRFRRFLSRTHPESTARPLLEVAFSDGCSIVIAGDVNISGAITSADVIYLVNFVFKGLAPPLPCTANGDVNCSGAVTSADIIYLVMHVFKGQPAPCDICNDPGAQSCI